MLVMEMRMRRDTEVGEVRHATGRIKKAIREKYPKIRRVYFDISDD
jgi:hypothetical protein